MAKRKTSRDPQTVQKEMLMQELLRAVQALEERRAYAVRLHQLMHQRCHLERPIQQRDECAVPLLGERSLPMTITEALTKAVEGGYHIHGSDGMATTYEGASRKFTAWTRHDNDSSFLVPVEETFLDPRFWQALGRALGWQETCELALSCVYGHEECRRYHGAYWMYQWHCFIQAIADGQTPEVFFANLPTSPSPA